jgi:hypothetical protein
MADGGYQGNPEVIMPYRKPADGSELPAWKTDLNTVHKRIRARVEHALAAHEVLEHPPKLPPQTRRRLVRHPRCRPHAKPGHDPLNHHNSKPRSSSDSPRFPQDDHYGTAMIGCAVPG